MQPEARYLFSRSYAEARQKFLQAAARRGLSAEAYELPIPGADGESLATDVVRDGPSDASKLVIVISGVHGVEGYCGSAIQTGLLEHCPVTEPDTAALYVHAVNPHGFSHSRRETQENVDLNRNFIDFSRSLPVHGPYAEIHELLLPKEWPPSDDNELALFELRRRWGAKGFQRAVALGQYQFADGMHFGGHAPTWSNLTFYRILQRHARQCQHLGSIDIHTGLGAYSVGERIFACLDEGMSLARARRWWGNVTSVHAGTSNSIPMTGPIQFALFDQCAQAVQTNLCLEFGTYPTAQVIGASRAEHWLHRHGSADPLQAAAIRQSLKDAFYPQADDWQQAIWQQAQEVFLQTVKGLQEN